MFDASFQWGARLWPIGIGSTLRGLHRERRGLEMGTFETVQIHVATPPDNYPPIYSSIGGVTIGAAALVGAVAGGLGGATYVYSQRFESSQEIGAERIEAARADKKKED